MFNIKIVSIYGFIVHLESILEKGSLDSDGQIF